MGDRVFNLTELTEKLELHRKYLTGEEGGKRLEVHGDLRCANLRGADLRWAILRGANLERADLRGANLKWATLRGADLQWTTLREAELQGVDFREANLQETDLSGTDLSGANLRKVNLGGADFRGADLRYVDLKLADFNGADLRGVKLSEINKKLAIEGGAKVDGESTEPTKGGEVEGEVMKLADRLELHRKHLAGEDGGVCLDLRGANLNGVDLGGANLTRVDLRDADLRGANLRSANLWEAKFRGADLGEANLWEAKFQKADLRGAKLSEVNRKLAGERGAKVDGDGENSFVGLDGIIKGEERMKVMKLADRVELHRKHLAGEDGGVCLDLRFANQSGVDLWGADLQGANLGGAILQRANLRDADLRGVDLRGADLRGADLQGADLRGADLRGAKFQEVDLRGAKLSEVDGKLAREGGAKVDGDGENPFVELQDYMEINNKKIKEKLGMKDVIKSKVQEGIQLLTPYRKYILVLAGVVVVDHFLLGGRYREAITDLLRKLTDKGITVLNTGVDKICGTK